MRTTRSSARLAAALVAVVAVAALAHGTAGAQERGGPPNVTISPSGSSSQGSRAGDRARSPGFVVLLVLLALGLVWQFQRARRTTYDVSARSLDDLERSLSPESPSERGGRTE
jgi:cbb3-type cytochrome oxidase subunit 3